MDAQGHLRVVLYTHYVAHLPTFMVAPTFITRRLLLYDRFDSLMVLVYRRPISIYFFIIIIPKYTKYTPCIQMFQHKPL